VPRGGWPKNKVLAYAVRHNPGYGIMPKFMASRGEVSLDRVESLRVRQGHRVGAWRIMRAVAAMDDADRDRVEEIPDTSGQFSDRRRTGRLGIVVPRQPVDLRGVENVIPLHEPDCLLGGLTGLAVGLGLARRGIEHAERAALALADMAT
jgi:hypothetical protein